jgi:hypothetical protein
MEVVNHIISVYDWVVVHFLDSGGDTRICMDGAWVCKEGSKNQGRRLRLVDTRQEMTSCLRLAAADRQPTAL